MSSTPKIRFSPSARRGGGGGKRPSSQPSPHRSPRLRLVGSVSARNSNAKVGLADEVLLRELVRLALHLDAPDLQQVSAIHELEHLANVLLHDENRVALFAHAADQVEDA